MVTQKTKLLFLVNDLSFFCTHRLPIAEEALNNGFIISICYGECGGANLNYLATKGYKLHWVPMERGGKNIFKDLKTIYKIWTLFSSEKPDIVHAITIKPYLYGGIVSRFTRIPSFISAVSGLGTIFIHNTFKSKLLRFLLYPFYSFAFNHPNQTVIVQNIEDAKLLSNWGILDSNKVKLIKGSGVNLDNFTNLEEKNSIPIVCFASRLLADKGIYEFIGAARILKNRNIQAQFYLAGNLDLKNSSSISDEDLSKIKEEGCVEFIGFQDNIPDLFSKCHIICLPSYREGLPKILIEAAAAARPVVTTDVPGCRDAIEPDVTGLLVPVMDKESLADALENLIVNPQRRRAMGKAGRLLAEREFKLQYIIDAHLKIYKDLCK